MALARLSDPETSHEAAASVKNITTTQAQILKILCERPMTDEALVAAYGLYVKHNYAPKASESGIRSRRAELVRSGRVVDTGNRQKLSSGRHAIVWAAA